MERDKLSNLINKSQQKNEDKPRNYIGASSIGSDCYRQIWYQYKGFAGEVFPPKTKRTLEIGKKLEDLIISWVKKSGVQIEDSDIDCISSDISVFQGHIDSVIFFKNEIYILEIKTAKDASFKIFTKNGLKIWNPQYYAQIQSYMGMSGIFSAYILVLNKDNSELSDEFVTFDMDFYEKLVDKAKMIAGSEMPPPKINGSPLWYQCKMCKYNKICHK